MLYLKHNKEKEVINMDLQTLHNARERLLLEIESGDLEITDNINEAIAVLPDGTLISGEFDCGIRGLDHNGLLDAGENWDDLHNCNIIRLVPESETALINQKQRLNDIQLALLDNSSYTIERY